MPDISRTDKKQIKREDTKMLSIKIGMLLEKLHLIKTDGDKDFRFGHVMLVKKGAFRKKLIAYDADSGKPLTAMKYFVEEDTKYHEIQIDTIELTSLFGESFMFKFTEQERKALIDEGIFANN